MSKFTISAGKLAAIAAEKRRGEIVARLDEIDLASVRPLRAKLAGSETEADEDKIAALEKEAATLREEMGALK